MAMQVDPFRNRHKFQDDAWRQIKLNDLERDVIDSPEFQRLFRTSQLGFVDLAYQTANHTRGAHCIGACYVANLLTDRLNDNTRELYEADGDNPANLYAPFEISFAERILIRLGALLHDLSHGPLSHDLERKTHRIYYGRTEDRQQLRLQSWYGHYDKHDDYEKNPLLFILICDTRQSVLARILERYSDPFYHVLTTVSEKDHPHLYDFVRKVTTWKAYEEWDPRKSLLPNLLFHLLTYETPREAQRAVRRIATSFEKAKLHPWHLGPTSLSEEDKERWHTSWYQPFRHDIIGNTLSADLIDYLTRDPQRLAIKRRIDLHLLNYYVLVHPPAEQTRSPKTFRCAIDLYDHKRGTTRMFLLNDLFRLLDLRHEIHEKAVMHQSANAMLSRGLLLLKMADKRPSQADLVAFGHRYHALQSEDLLMRLLLDNCDDVQENDEPDYSYACEARRIFEKIIERRVYRPLMVIPGDRAVLRLQLPHEENAEDTNDFPLRTFAALIDSAYYSPFLLFVCSCVETYLEGVFDEVTDLLTYAQQSIAADGVGPSELDRAMRLVPSRVLIWTSPYKQLYKDPAVVVALDGCVGQIDQICTDESESAPNEKSTRDRITNAISDADSKYATLWRLYVFISDGLYYSGILNKLFTKLGINGRESHHTRLENAQSLLTVAFEAVCSDWSTLSSTISTVADRQQRLEKRMDRESFKLLVGKWLADYKNETSKGANRAKGLSTVAVGNYSHGYTLNQAVNHVESRRCRDTRYKFDISADEIWRRSNDPLTTEFRLVEFLQRCGIDDGSLLSDREFKELVELYGRPGMEEHCQRLVKDGAIKEALKSLWSMDTTSGQLEAVDHYPTDEKTIRAWLVQRGEKLKPQQTSYRHWKRGTEEITSFVLDRDKKIWPQIFADLELRIENEAMLYWDNTKTDQMMENLRRKWPR
jgi:HD superfamily phosphohydrolase